MGYDVSQGQRKKGERLPGRQNGHEGHTLEGVETPPPGPGFIPSFQHARNAGAHCNQVRPSRVETLRIVLLDNAGRVAWDRSCSSGADRSVVSIIQAADGSFTVMGNVCRF